MQSLTISLYRSSKMWRGTTMPGNRTRLGSGKRAISIKSYEEFFVLPRLIDGAATSSEEESAKATAKAFCKGCNFPGGPHDRILDNLCRLIDPVDDILANAIETGK